MMTKKLLLLTLICFTQSVFSSSDLFKSVDNLSQFNKDSLLVKRLNLKGNKGKTLLEFPDDIQEILKKDSFYLGDLESFALKLNKSRIQKDHLDRDLWFGKVKGDAQSSVILLYNAKKNSLSGQISYGEKSWTITTIDQNIVTAYQVKKSLAEARYHREFQSAELKHRNKTSYNGSKNSDSFVDVMIVYTAAVSGAIADPDAEAAVRMAGANEMLADSCANFRFRLVHSAQVSFTDDSTTTLDIALDALQDGTITGLDALRTTQGADLVQIWIENNSTAFGGLGYTTGGYFDPDRGWSSVWRSRSNDITVAHELGHNLDLTHDRHELEIEIDEETSQKEGHGFVDIANRLESVMAYPNQCNDEGISCADARKFSNPGILHSGVPFGLAQFANSISKLNDSHSYVAAYAVATSALPKPSVSNSSCVTKDDNKELHCFIATAAFDSSLHPYLDRFREFRDNVLRKFEFGEKLIQLYYKFSPKYAKIIEENDTYKKLTRIILTPVAWLITYYKYILGVLFLGLIWKLRKIAVIFFCVFLFNQEVKAQYAAATFFGTDTLENPAGSAWKNGRVFGLSYIMASAKENYDHGPAAEKKDTGYKFNYSSGNQGSGLEVAYSAYTEKRTRSDAPDYDTEEKVSLLHGNYGFQFMADMKAGIKIKMENRESASASPISKTILGLGLSKHMGGGIFLGAGSDMIMASGENIPDSKWLDIYLSGLLVKPNSLRAEVYLIRSPQVTQTDGSDQFIKGSELTTAFEVESYISQSGLGFTQFIFGFGYSLSKEESPSDVSDGERERTQMDLKLAGILTSGSQVALERIASEDKIGDAIEDDTRYLISYIIPLGAGGPLE